MRWQECGIFLCPFPFSAYAVIITALSTGSPRTLLLSLAFEVSTRIIIESKEARGVSGVRGAERFTHHRYGFSLVIHADMVGMYVCMDCMCCTCSLQPAGTMRKTALSLSIP